MIYTLTLNPSIDYIIHLKKFQEGITNRATSEEYYIGGKGINVSLILAELGIQSTALGFIAGFTGEKIEAELQNQNIQTDFIRLKHGISRINLKLKSESETEINAQGPHIEDTEFKKLFEKISQITNGDTLVLAGSIPKSVSENIYETILKNIKHKNIRIILDTTGKALLNSLKYKPFLIKPNLQELSELFSVTLQNSQDIEPYARQLIKMGAQNVLISLGGNGAVLFAQNGHTYRYGVLKEKVLNTVGAGDSMIAGFIAGFEKTGDFLYALKSGTACGNATAFSPGLASKEKIDEIFRKLD